ncbi:MAG: TonB-dependent receptor plug domain-containing protein [Bacteroidetes bacterium]|nr:TonB-dependent receptor plug domain-containing protein [Bacteroidota bacterium]
MKKIIFIITLCFSITSDYAQVLTVYRDTLRNIELSPTIIKNSRYPLHHQKTVNTISKQEIQKQNMAQDLPFLLNGMSSVVVNSDAGTGTGYTGIRIRGADLTRINVTMNGVPVNDAESQATYFVNTPDLLSSSKEIEVSKGVGSSKNGVGNFGAGIAINTLDIDNETPALQFQTDYGSFNTLKRMLKLSTGLLHRKMNATLRLSNITSDGYIQRSASNLKGMQFTTKYLLSAKTQLVFNYIDGKEKTGQAWNGVSQDSLETNPTYNELGMKSDGTFYDNQTDNYRQQYYQFFVDHKLNQSIGIGSTLFYTKGNGYYEEYKTAQPFADYFRPDFIIGNDTITQTDLIRQLWLDNDFYGGRIYANYFSKKIDGGVYLNYNEYKGRHFGDVIWAQNNMPDHYRWYSLQASKKDLNVYGMLDYRLSSSMNLFVDMQVRNVHYVINGFRRNPTLQHNLKYTFANPKLKFSWKGYHQLATLVAGLAQKEPNREDVEAGNLSVPKPEKLFNLELNYSRLFWNQFAIQANAFLMQYKDQLVLTGKINDVGAYTRSNVDQSYRAGIEVELLWRSYSGMFDVRANIALSQNKINKFTEFVDDYDQGGQLQNQFTNTDIAFSPRVIAGYKISYYPFIRKPSTHMTNASINLMSKYVGTQFLDNTSNLQRAIDAFITHDLLVNCPVQIQGNAVLTCKAAIYNLFDAGYQSNGYTYSYRFNQSLETRNYFFPQSGRRYMVGLGIGL